MRAPSFLVFVAISAVAAPVWAEPLTEVALYHRCFVRLTGQFPNYIEDERLEQIRSGEMTAVDACMAVFDAATLQAQGNQERPLEPETGEWVLQTFQTLHSSWFLSKQFPNDDDISLGTETFYEAGEPAAFITRALLNPEVPASSILTAQEHLRVIRNDVGSSLHEIPADQFVFDNPPILRLGDVVGIERAGALTRAYTIFEDEEFIDGTIDIGAHLGGGLIGSAAYLLMNVNETLDFVANGGRKMPRKWAKAVLHDVLCRDLPAVRIEDAIPYVVADSVVPFRRQARCSQCHSSIDRMASTIRGFNYAILTSENPEFGFVHGGIFGRIARQEREAEAGWPAVEDSEYGHRPPRGTIYYRDHAGELVDIAVEGPNQVGARLAERDGPYICLAQRYYRYFTGIDAYIGDPQNFPAGTDSRDAFYRDLVIGLGRQLRQTGDLRGLIEAILRSTEYRESDFGVSQ